MPPRRDRRGVRWAYSNRHNMIIWEVALAVGTTDAGPALGGCTFIDFALHVFRHPVCVRITSCMVVPMALALSVPRISSRLKGLTGGGRWHRSRVPSVLQRPRQRSAVDTLAAFFVAAALLLLRSAVDTRRVRCGAASDGAASCRFEGSMPALSAFRPASAAP